MALPDIRFAEIRKLLEQNGWNLDRVKGSHHYFTRPGREPISIPVHKGKVKGVYEREIRKAIAGLKD